MNWSECVLDASMGVRDGMFCFCPIEGKIEGEFTVVEGMNYISDVPPESMKLVAIVHPDGHEAVEQFCSEHEQDLQRLRERLGETP